jgi:hypothetical protein
MRHKSGFIAAGLALLWAAPASADTVCDWMEFANRVANGVPPPPPGAPRTPDHDRAITQIALAMFEAVNAIDRRYESYLSIAPGEATASQDAAAATAAYRVLLAHYPDQKAALDESNQVAMDAVSDPARREAGRLLGEKAAVAALAVGGIDPAYVQQPYRPRTMPGVWVGATLPVIEPFSTAFKPWVVASEALRPPPPPALTSARWARDYDEVRRMGGRTGSERTPHQSLMARYRITPDMAPSLRLAAEAEGRAPVQNARMFALVQMAADDTYMATQAAKVHYNFWRPITAIRNGADDGNDATAPDPGWAPLINTPNHPEYPCGHCTFAGAVAEVMSAEVGPRPKAGVRVSSYSIPNAAVQVLPSSDEWVRQVSDSRIYGGVHYRFSNEAGEAVGRGGARMVMDAALRPLPASKQRRAR